MNTTRSNFFGSVIGLLVASKSPFVAEPVAAQEFSPVERLQRLVNLFSVSDEQFQRCRIYAISDRGERFLAPGLKTAERDMHNVSMTLVAEALDWAGPPTTLVALGLVDHEGVWLEERPLDHGIHIMNGVCSGGGRNDILNARFEWSKS